MDSSFVSLLLLLYDIIPDRILFIQIKYNKIGCDIVVVFWGVKMPFYSIFRSDWIGFIVYFFLIISMVGISNILFKRLKVQPEVTRYFVHIGVGILVVTCPFTIRSPLIPAILASIFIVLNSINIIMNRWKGIHGIERFSLGTVFFPLSFLILILLYWDRAYILITGMLIMTLSDPLASIIGNRFMSKRFKPWKDEKSVLGSFIVFISSFFITVIVLFLAGKYIDSFDGNIIRIILISIYVAVISMVLEAASWSGSDNITLPLFSALMLDICIGANWNKLILIGGWLLFSFFLAFASLKLHSLDLGGAFGAMIIGSIVFSIGGLPWVVPMVVFYILSSILSKIGKSKKKIIREVVEKDDIRDVYQVLANGIVAFICALLYWYTGDDIFFIFFLGSIAAATADTWGTEIGVLSKAKPVNIIRFYPVEAGSSGGITVLGTFGAFLGASALSISGLLSTLEKSRIFIPIIIGGFLGALTDSILGATIQAQYRCPSCGKLTEKRKHCNGAVTKIESGLSFVNNDFVNLICTFSGGVYSVILYKLFN